MGRKGMVKIKKAAKGRLSKKCSQLYPRRSAGQETKSAVGWLT